MNRKKPKPVAARPELKDLNFKVDPDFHRAFKAEAAARDVTMKELLSSLFERLPGRLSLR